MDSWNSDSEEHSEAKEKYDHEDIALYRQIQVPNISLPTLLTRGSVSRRLDRWSNVEGAFLNELDEEELSIFQKATPESVFSLGTPAKIPFNPNSFTMAFKIFGDTLLQVGPVSWCPLISSMRVVLHLAPSHGSLYQQYLALFAKVGESLLRMCKQLSLINEAGQLNLLQQILEHLSFPGAFGT
jgi:hypothetical protein